MFSNDLLKWAALLLEFIVTAVTTYDMSFRELVHWLFVALTAYAQGGGACGFPPPHPNDMQWHLYTVYRAEHGNGDGLFPFDIDGDGFLEVADDSWHTEVAACTLHQFGDKVFVAPLGKYVRCLDNFSPVVSTVFCDELSGEYGHRVDVFWSSEADIPYWSGWYWHVNK